MKEVTSLIEDNLYEKYRAVAVKNGDVVKFARYPGLKKLSSSLLTMAIKAYIKESRKK
jgi:hypothetical protein